MNFITLWCENCIHENDDDNPCAILTATMVFSIEEKEYPCEWVYDKNGTPCCTAFSADRCGEVSKVVMKMREYRGQLRLF